MPNIDEIRIVGQEITYDIRPKEDASHQNVSAEEKAQWNAKSDFSGNYADLQGKPDLSQFVTKAVDDLTNYYLKSETYTKQEVQQLLSSFNSGVFKIVDTLPTASAATTGLKIYLVPSQNQEAQNVKDEFITIEENGSYRWEQIGSTAMSLDGYVTETALNQALSSYVTSSAFTSALAQKQDKLVSGENIKTVNGENILGSGNIVAGDPNAIKYTEQSLTDSQKTQARTNIGAAAASALTALETAIAAKYSKPASGIPEADLNSSVQSALALARTSIQSLAEYYNKTEIDALLAAVNSEQYVDVTTLPTASASTLGKIYLVGPDTNGVYTRHYTSYDGSTYSWVAVGTTEINLANYATKAELDQLGQEVDNNADNIDNIQQEIDAIQPIVIEGNVTNAPDQEDITTDSNNLLKLANRPTAVNQKGYKILRKGATFASQVTDTNTIYEIRYPFTLSDDFTMPANCVLDFCGGIIGGAFQLTCDNTEIRAGMVQIFGDELTLAGSYSVNELFPEWFGAKGDGVNDDTNAIRKALATVNNHPVPLVFNSFKKYIISGPLNYFNNGYIYSVNTIIRGNAPRAIKPDDCGIVLGNKNVPVFSNATIGGEICGVNFICDTTSHTTDASSMFYRCELRGLLFEGCRVTMFNSFLAGSSLVQVSKVRENYIWSHYFAKTINDGGSTYRCTLVDSFIDGNRIVGQSDEASNYQNVDNVCFEFSTYAGSYIRNNFIDYFRVIYDPGEIGCNGNINSIGNQYQVFRYFYKHIGATASTASGSLNSIGDAFNWTKEENGQEEILDRYTKDTYTGYDGVTYNVPTYILLIENKEHIKIIDCILEGMLGNIVYINGTVQNDDTEIEFTCNVSGAYLSEHSGKIPVARHEGNPTDRNFLLATTNLYKISLPKYCMDTVNSLVLPSYRSQGVPTPGNYSKYLVGEKVIYSGSVYELQYLQRSNNSRFVWVNENPLPINILNADLDVIFNTIGAATFDLSFRFTLVFVKASASYNTVTSITIPNELRSIPLTIYNDGTLDVILSPVIVNGKAVVLKPKQCCVVIRPAYTSAITCLANSSEIAHSGTFADRPTGTDVYVGYQYFCTDRQTAEGATTGITITHKGSDVWVDALGRVVS